MRLLPASTTYTMPSVPAIPAGRLNTTFIPAEDAPLYNEVSIIPGLLDTMVARIGNNQKPFPEPHSIYPVALAVRLPISPELHSIRAAGPKHLNTAVGVRNIYAVRQIAAGDQNCDRPR